VNPYFFEIVRRAFDRYSWNLVGYRGGRRRVLARAHRDYRSPRKARKAAEVLREVVGNADIVDAFPDSGYRLPVASFEVVSDVLPLRVGPFDAHDAAACDQTARAHRAESGADQPA
jgi:hypothetical protein